MKKFFSLSLLAALSLFQACQPAAETSPTQGLSVQKLVVALKPDKNPDKMLQEKQNLEAFLSKELSLPVEVIIPLSGAVIQEGLANGSIDLAYLSATDMVKARNQGSADILMVGEIDGKTGYPSYWISLKEKPYASVEDLKGKAIAFSSKTSTSGFLIPYTDMIKKGLLKPQEDPEAYFGQGQVFYGTGYVSAVEQVLNKNAEAAAVSYYVLDLDKHLTPEQRAQLKVVAQQGPVPTHTIAVRTALSPSDRGILLQALEKM
ncbi:MAG: phosphate/phosphite/phosphonate ABC transporter substrate-binding protein [Blastochloris sp.]|nr:phosphate/phosphite/phosphonate ABC transporter substrate-binding protein [Blastochloris sp.]